MARYSVPWAVPMWTELIAVPCVATLRYCVIVICHETRHLLLFTGHLPGNASGKICSSEMLLSSPTSPIVFNPLGSNPVKSLWYWKQETNEIKKSSKSKVAMMMKQIQCKFAVHLQMQWRFCHWTSEHKVGRNACHIKQNLAKQAGTRHDQVPTSCV